jgi:SsrA-binding protein
MIKIISENRKASHDYFIIDKIEAGIKLTGTEIKSIRQNKVNINDSYVIIRGGHPEILNMHIAKYDHGNIYNHDETRARELLMHKHESLKMAQKVKLEGMTLIPLKVYLKDALCKIEVGLCKGKNLRDKRDDLKKKDDNRRVLSTLKELNR